MEGDLKKLSQRMLTLDEASSLLKINKGTLTPKSDLWMGPLYRKRSLRIWEIPEEEWLSHKPIPENQSKKIIKDTALLGIKDYEENRN